MHFWQFNFRSIQKLKFLEAPQKKKSSNGTSLKNIFFYENLFKLLAFPKDGCAYNSFWLSNHHGSQLLPYNPGLFSETMNTSNTSLKAHSYRSESDGKGGLWHLVEVCLLYEIWPFLGKSLKSTVVAGKSLQQQKKNVSKIFY